MKVEKSQSKGKRSEKKRKRSQGPGSQARKVESVNMQEVVDSLRNQAILAKKNFNMGIITLPGMDSLHDMVESNLGYICSTGNPPFSMKKKCVNFTIIFNSRMMGASSHE